MFNSDVKILTGVNLDNTYQNTLYFADPKSQHDFFVSKIKKSLSLQSYTRVTNNTVRVGVGIDEIIDCNYIMITNLSNENKYYYCFISNLQYISENVTEITYEIDVMQTFMFDYTLKECFVERQHSLTDEIGDNIVPESVDCGEYVYNEYGKLTNFLTPMMIGVLVADTEFYKGDVVDGVYTGAQLICFNTSDVSSLNSLLKKYEKKPESIVSIFMLPTKAYPLPPKVGGESLGYSTESEFFEITTTKIEKNSLIDGYTPKNKKLLTYPYNYLNVTAGKSSNIYRYEFFENNQPKFECRVPALPPIQVTLTPKYYKRVGNHPLNSETMILDGYPMCSWVNDSFSMWLAQNSAPIAATATGTAGVGLASAVGIAFPPIGVAVGVGAVSSLLMQGYHASTQSDNFRGNASCGNADLASNRKTYFGGRMSITKNYAKMIDNYFTKYGYAHKEITVPNISSRPVFNYVKTNGCIITGSIPSEYSQKIRDNFDNGVTFWKNHDQIGEYWRENGVIE